MGGPPCEHIPTTAWPSCTPQNVLASPRFYDIAGTIAQGCMLVIVMSSIVLNLGAGRRAFFQLLDRCCKQDSPALLDSNAVATPSGSPVSPSIGNSMLWHILVTVFSVAAVMYCGIVVNSLEAVLSILGGFCVATYGSTIPLLATWWLRSGASASAQAVSSRTFIVIAILMISCSLVGYFSVAQTLWKLFSSAWA